jgi:hypothetical protein
VRTLSQLIAINFQNETDEKNFIPSSSFIFPHLSSILPSSTRVEIALSVFVGGEIKTFAFHSRHWKELSKT